MKRATFITLFITTHIAFVFLQIHKYTLFVKETFAKQKNERTVTALQFKQQEITKQLYTAKNHATIKQFAQKQLNMRPIRLAQIKKLEPHDSRV